MNRLRLIRWLVVIPAIALPIGCRPAAPPPAERSAANIEQAPSWQSNYNALARKLVSGQTKEEVLAAIGEPTKTVGVAHGGDSHSVWRYEVETNIFLRVVFDSHDKLSTVTLDAQRKVGD